MDHDARWKNNGTIERASRKITISCAKLIRMQQVELRYELIRCLLLRRDSERMIMMAASDEIVREEFGELELKLLRPLELPNLADVGFLTNT